MKKYIIDRLFNNGTAYKILYIYTISKILRKVIIAHTRLWRYIDVVYKSQKWKGIHLKDRDRLLNINSTSIHICKSAAILMNSEKSIFNSCWNAVDRVKIQY